MPPLRVLIADDHQLFAETLGLTLDFDERVEVAGSARNGKEAVRLALDLQPDAVLMDLEMPVLDGFHATRLLRRLLPACPVVVLTASPSSEDVHRARSAGAAAYLTKGCSAEHVVGALLEAGTCVLPPRGRNCERGRTAAPGRPAMSAAPTFRESAATDEAAQAGLLYERYAGQLLGFCRARLSSREEAEDAVQQTFLNAHRSLRSGTRPARRGGLDVRDRGERLPRAAPVGLAAQPDRGRLGRRARRRPRGARALARGTGRRRRRAGRADAEPAPGDPDARVAGAVVPRDRDRALDQRGRRRDADLPGPPLARAQARPLAPAGLGHLEHRLGAGLGQGRAQRRRGPGRGGDARRRRGHDATAPIVLLHGSQTGGDGARFTGWRPSRDERFGAACRQAPARRGRGRRVNRRRTGPPRRSGRRSASPTAPTPPATPTQPVRPRWRSRNRPRRQAPPVAVPPPPPAAPPSVPQLPKIEVPLPASAAGASPCRRCRRSHRCRRSACLACRFHLFRRCRSRLELRTAPGPAEEVALARRARRSAPCRGRPSSRRPGRARRAAA